MVMTGNREWMNDAMARNRLFHGLTPTQMEHLKAQAAIEEYAPGQDIVREGDPPTGLYLMLCGQVDVVKKAVETGQEHRLATLSDGDTFGEMAILDSACRSATVRAKQAVTVARIPRDTFVSLRQRETTALGRMLLNLSADLSARLRHTNEITVVALQNELKTARARSALGKLIIFTILLLTLYNLLLSTLHEMLQQSATTTYISVVITAALAGSSIWMMKLSRFPMSLYGFRRGAWRSDLPFTLGVTAALCGLATSIKWVLIQFLPAMRDCSVFQLSFGHGTAGSEIDLARGLVIALMYGAFSPVQEIIARGALQSSFQEFLEGRWRTFWAIVLSNAMFAAFHIHVSTFLALLAMSAGFFWGWLFYRQRSLIGVSISHILVGWYALFILGLERIGG
jgi:CRP-like cAMP-binding protein